MDAIMIAGGQGFTGRYITQRLAASGRRVISYNRDFATDEDGAHVVQGELFDVARLVRVLKEHTIEKIVHTAALSHLKLSLEFPPVELSRGRRRSGYAVEIADVLPGLFNDLGAVVVARSLMSGDHRAWVERLDCIERRDPLAAGLRV